MIGRYVLATAAVVLLVVGLLLGAVVYLGLHYGAATDSRVRIGTLAEALTPTADGLQLDPARTPADWLQGYAWAMALDDDGSVIWQHDLPQNLNKHYTASEIASFSRWYLDDWPVFCWTADYGLFVAALPRGSVWKYNIYNNEQLMNAMAAGMLPALALLAGYLLVGAALPVWSAKRGQAVAREYRQALADTNSYVLESLRGLRDTLQYQDTAARAVGITAHSETLGAKQTALKYREGLIVAVTNTLILFTTLAVLGVSLWLYQRGELAAQGVLVCTLTALSSFGPVVALANLGAGLTQVFASADRVLALLDEAPVTPEVTDGENTPFAGAEVRGVSFGYAGEQVLREISLTIPEKKIVGITGRSGSGKSTLLRLLMRFWDVQTGSIRFGAEDIRRVNTAALRAQESLVTQETELFADTIGNNIRIAKRDAAQEEVEAACKKAALDDFIRSLPKGYDTPVGELGGTLSGGERQRIGVARAFLHDAPFLLLDEPTSNLDSLNEGIILRAVRAECKDRTVLLVSHRKSTMAAADVSFSVESGRVS